MRNAQRSTLNAQRSAPLPQETAVPHWRPLSALALLLLAASSARAARDPFWPLGYEPPKPEPVVTEQAEPARPKSPEAPPKPQPAPVKPISDRDWTEARKAFTVSGFTQSTLPSTGETRTLAMINRRSYTAGDTLCLTNAGIRFLWRVESVANRDLRLTPVTAERVTAAQHVPPDLQKTP